MRQERHSVQAGRQRGAVTGRSWPTPGL